jgi:hypothetical protein
VGSGFHCLRSFSFLFFESGAYVADFLFGCLLLLFSQMWFQAFAKAGSAEMPFEAHSDVILP